MKRWQNLIVQSNVTAPSNGDSPVTILTVSNRSRNERREGCRMTKCFLCRRGIYCSIFQSQMHALLAAALYRTNASLSPLKSSAAHVAVGNTESMGTSIILRPISEHEADEAHPQARTHYSISIVPGGLLVMSTTTRETPSTSLTMRVMTCSMKS